MGKVGAVQLPWDRSLHSVVTQDIFLGAGKRVLFGPSIFHPRDVQNYVRQHDQMECLVKKDIFNSFLGPGNADSPNQA
jgi:hypothetical protein